MSREEQQWQEYSNIVFSAIFLIEMVIKMIGFGLVGYLRDRFNIFDWLVVIISIADITVSLTFSFSVEAGGAISAFRIFRLFRVLKLVKSWKKFQRLIGTIIRSLKDVSNFSVLLFLFIFVYTLLGRELFAYKVSFDEDGNFSRSKDAKSPRNNFDSFINAIITIFIVLTGEQWHKIMYDHYQYSKYLALGFFISLIIMGQMILLNLFLAILLENFSMDEVHDKTEKKDKDGVFKRLTNNFKKKFKKCEGCFRIWSKRKDKYQESANGK